MSSLPGYDSGAGVCLPSPLVELADERLDEHHVRLLLKRDDLIHPELPGNKWRKLFHNLAVAREHGHTTLLTFGGAYSNHIRAVAAAGRMFGFSTIGIIRGERVEPLNWSLSYATAQGMELTYLDRETYRHKHEPQLLDTLRGRFGDVYVLPEGGSNALAVHGCAELPQEIDTGFDLICCSVGSGGTLAGIAAGIASGQRALGFSALKGAPSLDAEVAELQRDAFGTTSGNWTINHDFHLGGFARRTRELDGFITNFYQRHGIDLDWVYVAKMLYGVFALAERGEFNCDTTIVAVITGPAEPTATP